MTALNMSMMVVGLVITSLCLFTAKGEEEKVSITRSSIVTMPLFFLPWPNIEVEFVSRSTTESEKAFLFFLCCVLQC